jgi:hypothetical protein
VHVLALMLDEIAHDIVKALPRILAARQDVFDGLSEPLQSFGFQLMLGFDVADARDRRRIS